MQAGPCIYCGETEYPLSYGGPKICPACDCGVNPEITRLKKENAQLKEKFDQALEIKR